MTQPTYLGDGLYAKFENFQFVLLANDPHKPTDTVYLEYPEIYDAFVKFAERAIRQMSEDDREFSRDDREA